MKELEDSITNIEHENKELEEKASRVKITEDTAAVIREFKKIIKSKKKSQEKFSKNSRKM